jgi:hypothetical protein
MVVRDAGDLEGMDPPRHGMGRRIPYRIPAVRASIRQNVNLAHIRRVGAICLSILKRVTLAESAA